MASVKFFYFPGIMDGVKIRARITDDKFIYVIDLITAVTGKYSFNSKIFISYFKFLLLVCI